MKGVQHMGPICGLKVFSDNLLFSGEGPSLKIYDYISGELLFERKIFKRNKIHGIEFIKSETNENAVDTESNVKIVIWGGRSLSIFTLSELKNPTFELPHQGVGDWIFHCMFENENTLQVLNSHNIVHTVSLEGKSPQLKKSTNCSWKSILYSGTLHRNPVSGKITVLAGTVMNGILIWDLESGKLEHNITDHEGSIFNVISSPDGKYIISCSDDRSIKVFDMKNGKLLANGWGHGSRIWGLCVYNLTAEGFNIFSCSEDCTSRIWTFKCEGSQELKQERIVLGHSGRHVWSAAVDEKNLIGFTGGADGKVLVTDLSPTQRSGYWGHKWELKDISSESGCEFIKTEIVKEYVDFGNGLLAVTSEGKVLLLKNHKKWVLLFEDSRFARFCVLKTFKNSPVVILGNKLGNLILMKFDDNCEILLKKELEVMEHFNRLGNILTHECNNKYFALFESPNPKDKLLYTEISLDSLEFVETRLLCKPNDKIIISSVDVDTIRNYLLIGCRFATLLVYTSCNSMSSNEPIAVFKNIFKGDTISSMIPLNNPKECTLYLTNKDGTYHIMRINEDLEYEFLQSSRIQKGFLEGVIKLPNGDILFFGFKSDSFFVWNETRQYEVMREICGGPHRRWYFNYWTDQVKGGLKYRFIYTRASEVQIVEMGEPYAVELLATGLHGREIRDICAVPANDKSEMVVVTGAEDTTLKIGTLKSNGEFTLHWTYREHVAGLQSIHAINKEYIMSSSAREELYIWKISECDGKKCMTLHSSLPPSDANPDLRIMDFDSIEVYNTSGICLGFLLVSVYSNSTVKVVYYDYLTKKFRILVDDTYSKCCIFHVKFLCLCDRLYVLLGSTNGHITIYDINSTIDKSFDIKTTEEGKKVNLILKDLDKLNQTNKLNKLIINQQMHQSSIKALEIIQISPEKITLVTGGDDNALIVSQVRYEKVTDEITVDIESFNPSAASSTITTIKAVNNSTVIVGAVDQSLKMWDIDTDLRLIENHYTTVADTGCTEIVEFEDGNKYALVGGAGFSIFKI